MVCLYMYTSLKAFAAVSQSVKGPLRSIVWSLYEPGWRRIAAAAAPKSFTVTAFLFMSPDDDNSDYDNDDSNDNNNGDVYWDWLRLDV